MLRFILLACIFFQLQAYAQLIEIREIVGKETRNIEQVGIIDINGCLELKLKKDDILNSLSASVPENQALLAELRRYELLLSNQTALMQSFKSLWEATGADDRLQKIDDVSKNLSDFYRNLINDAALEAKFNTYFYAFRSLPAAEKATYGNYYVPYGIEQLNREIAEKLRLIKQNTDQQGVRVQVCAYLKSKNGAAKKIHVVNFDDYSGGEFYEIPRWVTTFSASDIEAFRRATAQAEVLNQLIDQNFSNVQELLQNNIRSYACVEGLIKQIKDLYQDMGNIVPGHYAEASTFLTRVQSEYERLMRILVQIKNPKPGTNALENFNVIQQEFILHIDKLPHTIDALIADLQTKIPPPLDQPLEKLIADINTCMTIIKSDIDHITSTMKVVAGLFKPSQAVLETGLNADQNSFDFTPRDLPEYGYIDLKYAGKRENGMTVEVQLVFKSKEDESNHRSGQVTPYIFTLQQLRTYSESLIGVIWADPVQPSSEVKLTHRGQFAPSGSLLLKWGSRKHPWFNNWSPGIGFNISTPDFDLDGIPDIGLGGTVALYRNIVTTGFVYNTKVDVSYWFVGLSLPFSTIGIPINTIETKTQD